MAVKLAEAFVEITARDVGLDRGLNNAKSKVGTAAHDMSLTMTNKIQAVVDAAQKAVGQVGIGLSAAITAPLVALGVESIKAASDLEQLEISFRVLLGGADKAKQFVRELQNMADVTPFLTSDLTRLASNLLVFGVRADEVLPILRTVGDAAAASPVGMVEGAHRMIYALGQIKQATRVTTLEMRQLTEVGVPAWDYIAEAMGKSVGEVRDLVAQGKIPAGFGINAILAGMHKQFGGMMSAQSKSTLGRLSTLRDRLLRVFQELGQTLIMVGKSLMVAIDPILQRIRQVVQEFNKWPASIRTATVVVLGLAAAAGPLLLAFSAIPGIVVGLVALAAILTNMGPLMAVIGAAATAFGVALVKLWPAIKAGFQSMWKAMKPGLEALKAAWAGMRDALASVWAKLQVLFGAVTSVGVYLFQKLGKVVGTIVNVLLRGVGLAMSGLTALLNTVLAVVNTVLNSIREVLRWIRPFVDALRRIPLIGGLAGGAYDKLMAFLDKLINAGKSNGLEKTKNHTKELNDTLEDTPTMTTEDDPVVEGYEARAEAILNEIEAMKRERVEASRAKADKLGIMGVAELGRRAALAGAGHQFANDWSRIPYGFQRLNSSNWQRLMAPYVIGEATKRLNERDTQHDNMIKTIIDYLRSIDRNTVDKTSRYGGHKGY